FDSRSRVPSGGWITAIRQPWALDDVGSSPTLLIGWLFGQVVELQTRDAQTVVPLRRGSSSLPLVTETGCWSNGKTPASHAGNRGSNPRQSTDGPMVQWEDAGMACR